MSKPLEVAEASSYRYALDLLRKALNGLESSISNVTDAYAAFAQNIPQVGTIAHASCPEQVRTVSQVEHDILYAAERVVAASTLLQHFAACGSDAPASTRSENYNRNMEDFEELRKEIDAAKDYVVDLGEMQTKTLVSETKRGFKPAAKKPEKKAVKK